MIEALYSFIVGSILGGVFALLHLPLPAPITWAGVIGIIGVVAGYKLITTWL